MKIKKFESFSEFSDDWDGPRWQQHFKKLKEDPAYKSRWIEYRDSEIKKSWMTLNPFEKESDVPDLPNPLNDFYKQRIIELGGIPKSELKDGQWYYGNFRNSDLGKWNSEKQEFGHWRYKFGFRWDTCNHFEDDNGSAVFVPLRKANDKELESIKKIENEASKNI
jgi:hypothetical protein